MQPQTNMCLLHISLWCQNTIPKDHILTVLELVRKWHAIKGMSGAKIISWRLPLPIHPLPVQKKEVYRRPKRKGNLRCGSCLETESSCTKEKQNNHLKTHKINDRKNFNKFIYEYMKLATNPWTNPHIASLFGNSNAHTSTGKVHTPTAALVIQPVFRALSLLLKQQNRRIQKSITAGLNVVGSLGQSVFCWINEKNLFCELLCCVFRKIQKNCTMILMI